MSNPVWTIPAQQDLAAIHDYYSDVAPDHATRVGEAALAAAQFLAEWPQAGPAVFANLRKWRVRRTDYILLYRPVAGGIEVLRMYHMRQNWRDSAE